MNEKQRLEGLMTETMEEISKLNWQIRGCKNEQEKSKLKEEKKRLQFQQVDYLEEWDKVNSLS